jgi:alkylated DNA repair protein alkB family protein 1
MESLDPHQRPPDSIRRVYKRYQKMRLQDLDADPAIVHLSGHLVADPHSKLRIIREIDADRLTSSFQAFVGNKIKLEATSRAAVFEHKDMSGLHMIPSLLPPEVQVALLSRLLHRDLAQASHLTNIHTHYNISYPPSGSSFFSVSPTSTDAIAHPMDTSVHRPLAVSQLLHKKMRWMTLGGQYDWTRKCYPETTPPPFPSDIRLLLESVFEDTVAEAAIVNLYSPGDTLSIHRDVAESSATGLISISIGCDAIFVLGTCSSSTSSNHLQAERSSNDAQDNILTLRLPSGSAVYMSGLSRFAWHGVPQVVAGTCPTYLRSWPARNICSEEDEYEEWRGWMESKRVNLNVRQMQSYN